MKAAIVISGNLRTFLMKPKDSEERICDLFVKHLVLPTNADVFAFTDTNDFYYNGLQYFTDTEFKKDFPYINLIDNDTSRKIITEQSKVIGENLKYFHIEEPFDVTKDPKYDLLNNAVKAGAGGCFPDRIINQFRKLKLAYTAMEAYEIKNGITYDVVIKWRFDNYLNKNLNLEHYDFINNDVYIPGIYYPLINDWHAFGNRKGMHHFLSLYDFLGTQLHEGRCYHCSNCYNYGNTKDCCKIHNNSSDITLAAEYQLFRVFRENGIRFHTSGYNGCPYRYDQDVINERLHMQELFSLGELYPSDFLAQNETPRSDKIEMKMLLDQNGAARLEKIPPFDVMYGKYFYRSGINTTMKNELKNIVESITKIIKLKENDLWIDVASNDGTLLSYIPASLLRVGIDPADDTYKIEAEKHANLVIQDYFSADVFKQSKFGNLKAKIITSIAMFYDLEHPETFINDVKEVLDDNGLWVMQLSYTPLMLEQLAFDNICFEHIYYYSLFNVKLLLEKQGFKIMDCQLNDTNGGSFRIYVMKKNADEKVFASQPYRDVCNFRIKSLLENEKNLKLDSVKTWKDFFQRIEDLKEQTVSFIKAEKAKGKKIYGYGASTKGNTLLQYFGLDHTLIDGIAERSVFKWGLRTVGTNIPIISEDEMRKANPDFLLILPWHFLSEFIERESDFLKNGGAMIVPCPKFEIIRG